MKKVIAIFSGYYYPHLGGIERYIGNFMKYLIKLGYTPILVTSNYNNAKDEEDIDGLKIIRLPVYNPFKNRYPILKHNKKARQLIKKLDDYDIGSIIVNTRFHLTSHVGANYGKKNNIPVYLIEHGSNYVTLDNKFLDFFGNRYEDYLTWKIKGKVKGFYGVSDACGKWLNRFGIKAAGTWYNSIDFINDIPKRKVSKNINFMYAGRLIKQKGVENILKAFSKLENEYNNIHLFIAGDGPLMNEYSSNYKSNNIEFLGKLDFNTLLKYYAKTDVFIYPPLWPEGLPTSILEAGMMGCSVICTNEGGIKEVVNSTNGIIVKKTEQDLYKNMKKMVEDEKLRTMLSQKLRKDVKNNFSWEVTTKKILKDIGMIDNEQKQKKSK